MYSHKRKKHSSRMSARKPVKFNRAFDNKLVLESDEAYYVLNFESLDEVRELLSVAHVIYNSWEV